jgi:hypothetical protein
MGSCCKASLVGDNHPINKSKTSKSKDLALLEEMNEASFVDILKKDGNTSQYFYSPPTVIQANGSDVITVHGGTIDLKKTTVSVQASEKVASLKMKFCEAMNFSDILLIFDGKVLDLNENVGSSVPQGCNLDVIAV